MLIQAINYTFQDYVSACSFVQYLFSNSILKIWCLVQNCLDVISIWSIVWAHLWLTVGDATAYRTWNSISMHEILSYLIEVQVHDDLCWCYSPSCTTCSPHFPNQLTFLLEATQSYLLLSDVYITCISCIFLRFNHNIGERKPREEGQKRGDFGSFLFGTPVPRIKSSKLNCWTSSEQMNRLKPSPEMYNL